MFSFERDLPFGLLPSAKLAGLLVLPFVFVGADVIDFRDDRDGDLDASLISGEAGMGGK